MALPKFNFVPERQVNKVIEDKGFHVSVTKNGCLMFSTSVVYLYELDQKFIKLFADVEKKTVGWSLIEGDTLTDFTNTRQLKKNHRNGIIIVSIKKLLRNLDVKQVYKNLEVKKYISPMHEREIYYITLT